jgi:hypothetical protein
MEEHETPSTAGPSGTPSQIPPPRANARITHHEIKAMKAVTTKPPPAHIAALNKFKTMLTDVINSFITPFAGRKGSSCDLNGHVFPKGQWEGEFPRCTHCNKEIRSTDEMGTR